MFPCEDHDRIVELLLKNGANVNAVHDIRRTALHLASKNGNLKNSYRILYESFTLYWFFFM